jgi:hypothetical protein
MLQLPQLSISPTDVPSGSGMEQYSPPNWTNQKTLYAITFNRPVATNSLTSPGFIPFDQLPSSLTDASLFTISSNQSEVYAGYNSDKQMNMFVFDAVKRAQHRQIATVTQHPLQTGYNISDHVIKQPATLTLEVGMSDAIQSYKVAGYTPMWTQNPSKSVSAYQQMLSLMTNRQLMDINTRLQTYYNMILTEIAVEDTPRTYFGGLTMTLNFQEVIIADVPISYQGARMQTTDQTTQGTVQPQPPDQPTVDQHTVSDYLHEAFNEGVHSGWFNSAIGALQTVTPF